MNRNEGLRLLLLSGYKGSERYVVFIEDKASGAVWYLDETPKGSSLPPGPVPEVFDSFRWILWDVENVTYIAEDTGAAGAAGIRAKLHEMRRESGGRDRSPSSL